MSILKRLFGRKNPSLKKPDAVGFAIESVYQDNIRLCYATSWEEVRRIVESNPQLLSIEGMAFIQAIIDACRQTNNEHLAPILEQNQRLMMYCADVGIEAAFADLGAVSLNDWRAAAIGQWEAADEPLAVAITALLAVDGPIAYCRLIRDHPIIVEEESQRRLKQTADDYRFSAKPDQADDLEQRMQMLGGAIEMLKSQALLSPGKNDPLHNPEHWARAMVVGARIHEERVDGDRIQNLERAIACYEAALEVYSVEQHPAEWAQALFELGTACILLVYFQQDGGLTERAIEHFRQALRVFSKDTHPKMWASVMMNLGTAFFHRTQGERGENIETAIQYAQQACEVSTQEADPDNWAILQANLGACYRNRLRGDRIENQELALLHSEQALKGLSEESSPEVWARTHHNLGNIYRSRVRGERTENAASAVHHYELALRIRTREKQPVQWATTHAMLAETYVSMIGLEAARLIASGLGETNSGEAARAHEELEKREAQARYHGELAMQVFTRQDFPVQWAGLQMGMAVAIPASPAQSGATKEMAQRSIYHLEQALTVFTRNEFPEQWAGIHNNLGVQYAALSRFDNPVARQKAIFHFEQALTIFQPSTHPQDVRKATALIASFLFLDQDWAAALRFYELAMEAEGLLFTSSLSRDNKEVELTEQMIPFSDAAYVYAKVGDFQNSVVTMERGRARLLAEALETERVDRLKEQGHEQEWDDFKYLVLLQRSTMGVMDTLMETNWADKDAVAYSKAVNLEAIRTQMDKAIAAIQQIPGWEDFFKPPTFDMIAATARADAPLVYLCATSAGGLALIVRQGNVEPVWLDNLTGDTVIEHWTEFMKAYQERHYDWQSWLDALDKTTRWLWDAAMGPIVASLARAAGDAGSVPSAMLIPSGLLGSLPLHAAWTDAPDAPDGRRYALDSVCFSYAPSAGSLAAARSVAERVVSDSLLAVAEPRPVSALPLPYASLEVAAVRRAFPTARMLQHEEATFTETLAALPNATVYHFACHGYANFVTPLSSGMVMAEDNVLTVGHFLEEHLPGARLAVLSACETGMPSDLQRPDEVVGLPAGFLQAGVAGVVASLWSVADLSTMMLIVRFFDNWRNQQMQPAEALRQAQQWMRRIDDGEKEKYIHPHLNQEDILAGTGITGRRFGNALADESAANTDFSHPFYWAAFAYTGA